MLAALCNWLRSRMSAYRAAPGRFHGLSIAGLFWPAAEVVTAV
jgi:hypothetical protein